ncbi:DM7 family protein GG17591 [Drosophila guanche]|uniref:Blast:DM7 family protein GG17591 n=1 Tax=Drosophila guanche TaxID=7266 RepID=A0A3B0J7N2_DROGU|nr:DM7 family protein GG17591 [Drosophila guanche]SPP78274.1 blast:DM7 family protein GG17591 [Drosophila guanche]
MSSSGALGHQQPDLELDQELSLLIPGTTNEMSSLIHCQHMHTHIHKMTQLTSAKLRYVPNLTRMAVPPGAERLVFMKLTVKQYPHDLAAVKLLKEEMACVCFDLPMDRFPVHAPINRMTFLSPKLLPPGFDAGAVCGPGVLPRKYYPIGMLPPQHKGPTPALFVGRRPQLATNLKMPLSNGIGKPSAETRVRLKRCQVALGFVGADANTIAIMQKYIDNPLPTQYNIYVPDLSDLKVVLPTIADAMMKYAMTIISTVVQPHVPQVCRAAMNAPGPKFDLPAELFPPEIIAREPVFLPHRYLPKNFDVGCVFAPGALPYSWFHGILNPHEAPVQHNYLVSPPLFFGRWKTKQPKIDSALKKPKRHSMPMLSELALKRTGSNGTSLAIASGSKPTATNAKESKPSVSTPTRERPTNYDRELVYVIFNLYGNEKEIAVGETGLRKLIELLICKKSLPDDFNVNKASVQYRAIMHTRADIRDGKIQARLNPFFAHKRRIRPSRSHYRERK